MLLTAIWILTIILAATFGLFIGGLCNQSKFSEIESERDYLKEQVKIWKADSQFWHSQYDQAIGGKKE